jgi:hypothetical protein
VAFGPVCIERCGCAVLNIRVDTGAGAAVPSVVDGSNGGGSEAALSVVLLNWKEMTG